MYNFNHHTKGNNVLQFFPKDLNVPQVPILLYEVPLLTICLSGQHLALFHELNMHDATINKAFVKPNIEVNMH
jgi:hypothetical protein